MGTFGTGPFSSDGAMDFLDELAEPPVERRAPALAHLFRLVTEKPDLLGREFFADEVVAAVAVVAAALPGGRRFDEELERLAEQELVPDVRLAGGAPDLAASALDALASVAGPAGPWLRGWTSEAAATEAREVIAELSRVLALAGGDPR